MMAIIQECEILSCDNELEPICQGRVLLPVFPRATGLDNGPGLMLGALPFLLRFRELLGGVGDRRK
jgi:hypothetical protein